MMLKALQALRETGKPPSPLPLPPLRPQWGLRYRSGARPTVWRFAPQGRTPRAGSSTMVRPYNGPLRGPCEDWSCTPGSTTS